MEYDGLRIGQAVREIRLERGMTIEQLCEAVDKSVSHIHQMELGSRKMSIDLLLSLVSALNTDANCILGIEPERDIHENSTEEFISVDNALNSLPEKQRNYLKEVFLNMIQTIPAAS